MATNQSHLDILIKRRIDNGTNAAGAPSSLKSGELAMNEVGHASGGETLYYGVSTAEGIVSKAIAGRGAFVSLDSTNQSISGTKTFIDARVQGQSTWETVTAGSSLVSKDAVFSFVQPISSGLDDRLKILETATGSGGSVDTAIQTAINGLSSTVHAEIGSAISGLSSTVHAEIGSAISGLSGTVDSLVQKVSSDLFGTATAPTGLSTVSDIGVAVKSLQDYNTDNHFLSASSPSIATGDLTLASGSGIKYSDGSVFVNSSKNVNVANLSATGNADINGNLTVTGNLSVLGDVTYLDTQVTTMSAVVASLHSDTATTLDVKQTGLFDIATFGNSSGTQLSISNSGSLSAKQSATFDAAVTVGTTLEVGTGTAVLYADSNGVGVGTETLAGYTLKVGSDSGTGGGSMYVAGSATVVGQLEVPVADSAIDGSGSITNGGRAVNVTTLWSFISALDGGTF